MPKDVEPAELAELLEFAKRPRVDDWSLRAALTRYAQPQPQRVGDLLDVVRRIEFAISANRKVIETKGPDLWDAVQSTESTPDNDRLVGLLRATLELDHLGDDLAAWAADPSKERPDDAVTAATTAVADDLDALGIPREEPRPPPRSRG